MLLCLPFRDQLRELGMAVASQELNGVGGRHLFYRCS